MNLYPYSDAFLVFLLAWMLFRTLKLQRAPDQIEPAPIAPIDANLVSKHLSQAIQFKTISKMEMSDAKSTNLFWICTHGSPRRSR